MIWSKPPCQLDFTLAEPAHMAYVCTCTCVNIFNVIHTYTYTYTYTYTFTYTCSSSKIGVLLMRWHTAFWASGQAPHLSQAGATLYVQSERWQPNRLCCSKVSDTAVLDRPPAEHVHTSRYEQRCKGGASLLLPLSHSPQVLSEAAPA